MTIHKPKMPQNSFQFCPDSSYSISGQSKKSRVQVGSVTHTPAMEKQPMSLRMTAQKPSGFMKSAKEGSGHSTLNQDLMLPINQVQLNPYVGSNLSLRSSLLLKKPMFVEISKGGGHSPENVNWDADQDLSSKISEDKLPVLDVRRNQLVKEVNHIPVSDEKNNLMSITQYLKMRMDKAYLNSATKAHPK